MHEMAPPVVPWLPRKVFRSMIGAESSQRIPPPPQIPHVPRAVLFRNRFPTMSAIDVSAQ
jgi:hypothetical protein